MFGDMNFKISDFGKHYLKDSGIFLLMKDLDTALNQRPDTYMLGGGNPGFIPEIQEYFYNKFLNFINKKNIFYQSLGIYDSPLGDLEFRKNFAQFINQKYNWKFNENNIAITAGSQNAFFMLFNIFSGNTENQNLKILFPFSPEYIGYDNIPLNRESIVSFASIIKKENDHFFSYELDRISIINYLERFHSEIGCIAVSSPSNPTGKILEESELNFLKNLSEKYSIPVIIDSAYGIPFPDINYVDQPVIFCENFIYVFSLSKIGLPGLRTGFIVANEDIIELIGKVQAVELLAPMRLGTFLLRDSLLNNELVKISKKYIRPFYQTRRNLAIELLTQSFTKDEIWIHKSQGAFFLWVIFPEIKIHTLKLYEILKEKGVIVVPGIYYYFNNSQKDFREKSIRISFSQDPATIQKGLQILVETVKNFQS